MKTPRPETNSVQMPSELLAEARKAAIEEHRPAEELVSDAVRHYLEQRKRVAREQRPEGNYSARKPDAQRARNVRPTQAEAIDHARQFEPGLTSLVERVRHTSEGKPDQWRKPSLAQLLMESPFAGANLNLERRKDYTRFEL